MARPRNCLGAAIALAALVGMLPGAAPARDAPPTAAHLPGRMLVKFAPGADRSSAHGLVGAAGRRRLLGLDGWELVRLPSRLPISRALAAYRRLPGVVAAEPDYLFRAAGAPDDPCMAAACVQGLDQWNLWSAGAPLAWEIPGPPSPASARIGRDRIVVAVVDSRVDASHPDFVNAGGSTPDAAGGGMLDLARARSWVAEANRAGPYAWHGTFVAGIVGAAAGNGLDIAGLAYDANVLPLAVLDGGGRTDAASLAEAIVYARRAGARVVNLSLGADGDSSAVHEAIVAAASGEGAALVVAAAGNGTKDRPFYPGSYPEVMSVSGHDASGGLAGCSNYNDNVSVSAPARHVVSLAPMPARVMAIDCGTSAAAPHVAATAALLFAQNPARTAGEVRAIVERTADDDAATAGRDPRFGFGRVNVDRALRDGAAATVVSVAATIPPRAGGTSTITAVAYSAAGGVTAAEGFLGRPGDPAARFEMRPADGGWGGKTERLVAEIPVAAEARAGAHTLWVRAFDGSWGAAATGTLAVDRTPPIVGNLRAGSVVRGSGRAAAILFTLRDEFSRLFATTMTISGPDGSVVWQRSLRERRAGAHSDYWSPPAAALPGPYRITVWAWDEAGNTSSALADTIVV